MAIKHILERCCREIPATLGAAIIDVAAGAAIASLSLDEKLDLGRLAPTLAEAVRRHRSALEALSGDTGKTEDLILTTPRGSLLLHVFGGEGKIPLHAVVLAAGRLANPGMARLVLATYEARLLEELQ